MAALSSKLNGRQKFLLLVMVLVGIFFSRQYLRVALEKLPTDAALEREKQLLESRKKDLAVVQKRLETQGETIDRLRDQAAIFWRVPRKQCKQDVMAAFSKIARNAQVQRHRVDKPKENKVLNLENVYEVEFSVQVDATMREVTRLLAEIERSKERFFWSECTIRPDNTRAPKKVRLTGKVRALVLSDDALDVLAGKTEEEP